MNLPDLLGRMNAYAWLIVGAVLLIAVSLMSNDAYMSLWVQMFLFGVLGFANKEGMKQYVVAQRIIFVVLLFVFMYLFVTTGTNMGLFFGF